jgi:DNA-binding NarL/FixJ family response regulator
MSEISTLLIGEIDRPEFSGVRATMQSLGAICLRAEVEGAIQALEADEVVPDVIVTAQSFPGQLSSEQTDRLTRLAPLSRIVRLLGSWCEGEARSGQPPPAAVRVYWHQWDVRARRELRRLIEDQCPSWGLPVTATDEERLLQSSSQQLQLRHGIVAIRACGFAMEDWLSAACRERGYSTVRLRSPNYTPIEGANAAIFDAMDLEGDELDQLRNLVEALSDTPIIVLLDFPRIEDHRRAIAAGATAVLSKPVYLDDLFWQLERVSATAG